MIDLAALVFSYGTVFNLQVDRLELAAGGRLALTGPSGCGKSTLLDLLAGILTPTSGRLRVAGTDLRVVGEADRRRWRRRHVGLVGQELELVGHLGLLENVLLPLRLAGRRPDAAARQRAATLIDALGLTEHRRARADRLSRGERQRTALARALLDRPPLVLLDEPTANLDDATTTRVLELLAAELAAAAATLVVATHDPRLLAACDQRLDLPAATRGAVS